MFAFFIHKFFVFVFTANAACLRGGTKHCRDVSETAFVCITGKMSSTEVAWELGLQKNTCLGRSRLGLTAWTSVFNNLFSLGFREI